MSRLSVIIPTRNRAAMLRRAVESAAGLDVVVVDDASTDETPEVLAELEQTHGVRAHRLEANRGPAYARMMGIEIAAGDLLLFLDDDDLLLPGGAERILEVAQAHSRHLLYLHNCVYADGQLSLSADGDVEEIDYRRWLAGEYDGELKPVARRRLFDVDSFDDTGAGGEGLLWTRVIRTHGAIVGRRPVIVYDTTGDDRLTTPHELVRRSAQNATIAERWLDAFGEDLAAVDRQRWRIRLQAALTYALLAGRRAQALALLRRHEPRVSRAEAAAWRGAAVVPRSILRALYLLRARWRSG